MIDNLPLAEPEVASAPGAVNRLAALFPKGIPSALALRTAGLIVEDDSIDVADAYNTLAAQVARQRESLKATFLRTKVKSMRLLILALFALADARSTTDEAETPADAFAHGEDTVSTSYDHVLAPDFPVSEEALDVSARGDRNSMYTPVARIEGMDVDAAWRAYRADQSIEARNILIEKYMPLVKYNAERIWARLPEGVELDDLKSAGLFGLMDAIDAFDMNRGVKFETYCVPRIRGAMLDELRQMDWVPRLVRSKASKLHEAQGKLSAKLGREPTVQELAAQMEMPVPELERMITEASAINLISLNKKWYETDSYKDVREIDILADKKAQSPERHMMEVDVLRKALKGLNKSERIILIGYYWEDMTMKEIGKTLDLSESRVSQMHSSIIARLGVRAKTREEFVSTDQ